MNFEEIWNTHKEHLKNFVLTKVEDDAVAEDILQEVGIKLHQNKKEIANHKNWLFQVTRNTIADYYRKKAKITQTDTTYISLPTINYQACPCDLVEVVIKKALPEKYGIPLIMSDLYKIPQKDTFY